jgi:hypothetical protein
VIVHDKLCKGSDFTIHFTKPAVSKHYISHSSWVLVVENNFQGWKHFYNKNLCHPTHNMYMINETFSHFQVHILSPSALCISIETLNYHSHICTQRALKELRKSESQPDL